MNSVSRSVSIEEPNKAILESIPKWTMKKKLCYGDCLDVMREHVRDESVDLIYLDPPFNSKRVYNAFFVEKIPKKWGGGDFLPFIKR